VFSSRLPSNLGPNRLAVAISDMRRAGRTYVDLTESNPTRAGFAYPADLLAPLSGERALSYEPAPFGAPETRAAVAASYQRSGVAVAPERIALTASTSEAYSLLFKLLTDAGDEVLVPRPSYPLFDHLTHLDLVTARPYALEYQGRWAIDLDSVERAVTSRTRAILVVSPNNPTGSFIGGDELEHLGAICARREIAIIADEVFADYELEPGAAAEAGRPARLRDVLSFSLGGLSKSVGLPQVKLGWIAAAGPQPLVENALERLELICDTYLSVSTPAQIAAPALLEHGGALRKAIAARVRANYRQLRQAVASTPSCSVLCAAGGWYGVMQVPTFESEEGLVLRLLTRHAVLAHPGYFFDFPRESFLIVSLLTPEDAFHEGISRILREIDRP
jgi:aspartate/methionine/tyrosine aminotransferase